MDGIIADLKTIRSVADRYGALLMVDDCHGLGPLGRGGRGTPDHHRVKPDIITGTLGKSLGGSIGGFVASSQPVIDTLRQKSRPYLFSNALPPMVVAAAIKAIDLCEAGDDLRKRLGDNTRRFRDGVRQLGFDVRPGEHPITPVMIGEGARAQEMARALYELGVYVVGFFFPVVPKGQARIRVQLSAALTPDHVTQALDAFATAGRKVGLISK
jgi:glycine C-acetyltransferase